MTKNDLKLRLKVAPKVCQKCAMCNYEILKSSESMREKKLIQLNLHITTKSIIGVDPLLI